MSPQGIGITTTYKTRVALEKPCKEHQGTLIGQLTDSRVSKPNLPTRLATRSGSSKGWKGVVDHTDGSRNVPEE